MHTHECLLRILRLNLIPAPRVVAPGPATRFPVLHVDAEGNERLVNSLKEARSLSKAVAGVLRDRNAEDFFVEVLPVKRTARLVVSGLSAESEPSEASCLPVADGGTAAARAAYALGLDRALVTVGFGPGGPWVMDVEPLDGVLPRTRVRFLGAEAEYIGVDPRTGVPVSTFFLASVTPEGEMAPFPGAGQAPPAEFKWVSSPMPAADMPLSTRLMFEGVPTPGFLRALDRSAAVLGMTVSPVDEARDRNTSVESLLGSFRVTGEGQFEYLTVPSLLWNPRAMKLLCVVAGATVDRYNAGLDQGESPGTAPETWAHHLDEIYKFQRAYYHADKGFFASFQDIDENYDPGADFRPAWGIDAPLFEEPCLTVGSAVANGELLPPDGSTMAPACSTKAPDGLVEAPDGLMEAPDGSTGAASGSLVTAGARTEFVARENLLLPDVLEVEQFAYVSPAWAPSTFVRPNPVLGQRLGLPQGAVLRGALSKPTDGEAATRDSAREVLDCPSVLSGTPVLSRLRIGPVVGIMAPPMGKGQRFGIETDRFRRIIELAAELGLLVYVFFPEAREGETNPVDMEKGLIRGWVYRERRGWTEEWLPLPDVVYDRHIPDVMPTGTVKDVAAVFQEKYPHAQFVNSLPFVRACRDKSRTHSILSAVPEIAAHIPETEDARDPHQVAKFVSARERSFLKLRGGTGSKGLSLIENTGTGYRITRRAKGAPPEITVVSGLDGLTEAIRAILEGSETRGRDFIIQEGIDLAPLPGDAGSAFEVRVVYQKGGAGCWLRTGMVCRANPTDERFVVPGEELHYRVGDFLDLALPGRANEIKAEVRRLARMIPPALERASGRGGEMSVDFGIDRHGKPWLIEVNSKPATLFRDIGAFGLRRLSLLRVLNYAISLFE